MIQAELYRSVLRKLSSIPSSYLKEVDNFLTSLNKKVTHNNRRNQILLLAGSWKDMSVKDFEDYQKSIEEVRDNMFSEDIEL